VVVRQTGASGDADRRATAISPAPAVRLGCAIISWASRSAGKGGRVSDAKPQTTEQKRSPPWTRRRCRSSNPHHRRA